MLSRLWLQDLVITRSRQKKSFRIIEEAENVGNRAAGRKYDVSESCIHGWHKNKLRLKESNSNRRAFRSQKAKHPELEKKAVRLCGR